MLLYTGSIMIILWGIAHLVPTKSIVGSFGEISEDNKKIVTMEVIAEGLTLIFVGVLPLLVLSWSIPKIGLHLQYTLPAP